ncbi:MAG: hypothetical protein K2P81_12030 [Bacteriovoracaceae bacterium]|nr:hypothetical protein [Bacteriovoracaceae bacterium]
MQPVSPEVANEVQKKVSLESLSQMTGFPVELIQQELFLGQTPEEGVSLEELRSAMLNFIDSTLLNDKE